MIEGCPRLVLDVPGDIEKRICHGGASRTLYYGIHAHPKLGRFGSEADRSR